jgi:hypothetical protein
VGEDGLVVALGKEEVAMGDVEKALCKMWW